MQLTPGDLDQHLLGNLAPIYLVFGDEPLQHQESLDAIRKKARSEGYDERITLEVDKNFDWNTLALESASQSLFCDRKTIELRMPEGKPGMPGSKALKAFCEDLPADVVLLIISGKLDGNAKKSVWFKALDKAGITIPVYAYKPEQLPAWIKQRALSLGFTIQAEAAVLLAEKNEGNMLACLQEIQKLSLTIEGNTVDVDILLKSLFDNARFSVYNLIDTALEGDSKKVIHIIDTLQQEGSPVVMLLWVISKEVRSLASMAFEIAQGKPVNTVMNQYRVWGIRQKPVGKALRRLNPPLCHRLLRDLARADRVSKGDLPEFRIWDELTNISLRLSS